MLIPRISRHSIEKKKGDVEMNIKELFMRFIVSPDGESYMAVRAALIHSDYYDSSDKLNAVSKMVDAGNLDQLIDLLHNEAKVL